MADRIIHVEGMSCNHCVETIQKAVGELTGIDQVLVDLENKQVSVKYDEKKTSWESIISKITDAGFEVLK